MKMSFIKTILFITFLGLLFFESSAQKRRPAIKELDKKNILKVNLLSPFLGTLSVQYEKRIDNESSFQYGFYYFSGNVFGRYVGGEGVCFTPEYRYYLTESSPEGAYIQPYVRLGKFWQTTRTTGVSADNFYATAAGIVLGKQWIFRNKISFDMYAGPLYTKSFFSNPANNIQGYNPLLNGYWLRAGCTVGVYF
ncbi:MAG: DUF3575 domain-containing protein [Bacteroidota bacterium]